MSEIARRDSAEIARRGRGKRAFDLAIAAPLLAVLSPVWAILAVLIKCSDRGPVLYAAPRVGRGGTVFSMYKFRTMVANADKIGGASTSATDSRITPIGHVMRRWKLDEIPQLWNVLKGDMSLVGPRPTLDWDVARYSEDERRLLDVRPGITDWASIRFRDEGEILRAEADPDEAYDRLIRPDKIRLGLYYVDHASVGEDLRILVGTAKAVLGQDVEVPNVNDQSTPYHRITEAWDTPADPAQHELAEDRYNLVARLATGKDLLEVGCGTAYGLAAVAPMTRSAIGVDIDPQNISEGQRRAPQLDLRLAGGEALPVEDESVDVVAALEMYYYIEDQPAFLREIRRVLRPGGHFVLTMPNPTRNAFQPSPFSTRYPTPTELRHDLQSAGFSSELLGCHPLGEVSKVKELLRKTLVRSHLIPSTLEGRARLKRLVFRNMKPLSQITVDPKGPTGFMPVDAQSAENYAIVAAIAKATSVSASE